MTTTEQQIRAHVREAIKEVTEALASTEKYDEDPALKGDQDELPDVLQKGIIDNASEEKEKSENTAIAEEETMSNETTEQQIREHIKVTIKEIQEEKRAQDVSPLSEPEHLSEIRHHIRNAINEVMVGMTPITRMPTQEIADNANAGEDTNSAIDKAELGFNTFDMQEWASIAGINEASIAGTNESITDDTGNDSMLGGDDSSYTDNVVPFLTNDEMHYEMDRRIEMAFPDDEIIDISDADSDEATDIRGMVVSAVKGDSLDDDVDSDEIDFMKFLKDFEDNDVAVIGDKAGRINYEEEEAADDGLSWFDV